ncbi:MAG TPA: adenylate/guanylate cyclase domain-containing protein [Leptolyngbyaceae cyanobacterium]
MPLKMLPLSIAKSDRKIPLRLALIVPFVLQISAAVGLTGYLSFRNGEQAVNEVAEQLRVEISDRIHETLTHYLETPGTINRVNASAIWLGQLNLEDTGSLTRQFWNQRLLVDKEKISAIYFGSTTGEFFGLGFQDNKRWEIGRAGKSTGGKFFSFDIDSEGNPTRLLQAGNPYDPRWRPWYKKAVQTGKETWSEIYIDFKEPRLKVTLAQPIYRKTGELRGVVGVDFVLAHIQDFLKQLKVGKTGLTFIMERSGEMVASSTDEEPFLRDKNGQVKERLSARKSSISLVNSAVEYLEKSANLTEINQTKQFAFPIAGEEQFLQITPLKDNRGIDWLIVVIIPKTDFMEKINANSRITFLLSLTALAISIALGIFTSRWIATPIFRLGMASQKIATGELGQTVKGGSITELDILARSFNQMADQLQQSFLALEKANEELEQRVIERTAALQLEQEKSERLLLNLFPKPIAEKLKNDTSAIAEQFNEVTILFADIVNFTPLASQIYPIELVNLLNEIFSKFDQLAEVHGLEKIKTIGDAYMVVGGLPIPKHDHAEAVAAMALDMQKAIANFCTSTGESFQIRIGINSGPVVAGVIGLKKFIYDLWGNTVNIASRMESQGLPDCIQVSFDTYTRLKDKFIFEERGIISVKGKGDMKTYWLKAYKADRTFQ